MLGCALSSLVANVIGRCFLTMNEAVSVSRTTQRITAPTAAPPSAAGSRACGHPIRPGIVTVMAEGMVRVRRSAFDQVGGWPGSFFLYHEGVDLARRLWNRGHRGSYVPSVIVHHPATHPSRHAAFHRLNARNRVWLARRRLPRLLIPVNLAVRAAVTEGLRGTCGAREPMSWNTVARLTRAGRPPAF